MTDAPKNVLIWAKFHRAWWRKIGMGFTNNLSEAARYTQAEADRFKSPRSIPVLEADAADFLATLELSDNIERERK